MGVVLGVAALACVGALAGAGNLQPRPSRAALPIWHIAGEGRGLPAADSSTVYFLSKRHEVLAVEATTGTLRWRQDTAEPGDATMGSVLLVAGPFVVAGDYNVIAFDRGSGLLKWRFEPRDGYAPGIYLGSAAGGLIFTGSPAGRLYAINELSGIARWSAVIANDGKTTVFAPASDNDVVIAGYTTFAAPNVGGIVALNSATGQERWRAAFPRASGPSLGTSSAGGPVLLDEVVVAASGDGTIHAFDRTEGSIRWSIPRLSGPLPGTGAAPDRDFRPLTRTGRTLVAGSLTGDVVAYDLETRRERWRYSGVSHGSVALGIASDDEVVYVPYLSGRLVAINVSDGSERWRMGDGNSGFSWPPLPDGDRLFAAGSKAGFFAFLR